MADQHVATSTEKQQHEVGTDSTSSAPSVTANDAQLGSTDDHVFTNPATAAHWQQLYEDAKYESRHRFDPNYKWTAEEERKLVRKVSCQEFCPISPSRV